MKKLIFAGNWKMNKTISETLAFAEKFIPLVSRTKHTVMIAPSFLSIESLADTIKGTNVLVGAQNISYADNGAYTGEVSADMLKEVGASFVIIGHSERRAYFGETNESVNKRIKKALERGSLSVIMCIGETLAEREKNKTFKVLKKQLTEGLDGVQDISNIIIAYEPVWAIGTGKTASIEQIAKAHSNIKRIIKELYGKDVCKNVKILYGGSVNGTNAKDILAVKNVSGALIGGASLDAEKFAQMINA